MYKLKHSYFSHKQNNPTHFFFLYFITGKQYCGLNSFKFYYPEVPFSVGNNPTLNGIPHGMEPLEEEKLLNSET